MSDLKDSGSTREFGTGAHRDAADGKGRCDLLPLDIVGKLMVSDTLSLMNECIELPDETKMYAVMQSFIVESKMKVETAVLEAAKQYEDGANKYGANNWKKGIPLHVFLDSATRHYIKWHRGDKDEPHDRAFMWNMLGAIWTLNHLPDMNDLVKKD